MSKVRSLEPELAKLALDDFQETPEKIEQGLQEIRDWLQENPYVKPRTNDQFLITFLRGCKYNMVQVKEKIESYYTVRTQLPEFFVDRNPKHENFRALLSNGVVLPLPHPSTVDGPRIMMIRFTSFDPSQFKMAEVITLISMVSDILFIEDDNSTIAGQVYILDLSNTSFKHLWQFTPSLLKKLSTLGQGGNPIRVKEQHFINTPTGFASIFKMFKGFFEKDDLIMKVHNNLDSLHKIIPQRLLPTELGGTDFQISDVVEDWSKKLDDYSDYFLEDKEFGVDLELKAKLIKEKKKRGSQ